MDLILLNFKKITFLLLIGLQIFMISGCNNTEKRPNTIQWYPLSALPSLETEKSQPGLAGALIGVSDNCLLIAGGTNFPQKPVWESGPKRFYDDIFILTPDMKWKKGYKLPYPLGYSTTLSNNGRIICVGGHDGKTLRNEVFSIKWNNNTDKLDFTELPALPLPLSNSAGATIDNILYIVGGQTEISHDGQKTKQACNDLYYIDMKNVETGWQKGPSFPGPARKNLVSAAQQTPDGPCLFIFSGLSFPPEKSEPNVMTDGLCYNPRSQQWTKIAPIAPEGLPARAVCGGTAIAYGSKHILVFGGRGSQNLASILKTIRERDNAKETGDTETLQRCEKIILDYFTKTEFRFNDLVLSYNTWTDTWQSLGVYPARPVTNSQAVWFNGGIVIPTGEIQPGVRTPSIMFGKIEE